MKSLLNRSLVLLLTLAFLVSTTGIVLASHRCLASAQQTISLYSHTGCCGKDNSCEKLPADEDQLASRCCVTEFSFHKIDISSAVPEHPSQDAVVLTGAVPVQFILNVPTDNGMQVFSDHSPPLLQGGKTLLISIHRLLV